MPKNPKITYVVDSGPYPYWADGLRMNRSEAISYLEQVHEMNTHEADRMIDMVTVQTVRDASLPEVESREVDGLPREWIVNGSSPTLRSLAISHLVREWRLTREEAASVLDSSLDV